MIHRTYSYRAWISWFVRCFTQLFTLALFQFTLRWRNPCSIVSPSSVSYSVLMLHNESSPGLNNTNHYHSYPWFSEFLLSAVWPEVPSHAVKKDHVTRLVIWDFLFKFVCKPLTVPYRLPLTVAFHSATERAMNSVRIARIQVGFIAMSFTSTCSFSERFCIGFQPPKQLLTLNASQNVRKYPCVLTSFITNHTALSLPVSAAK